MQPNSPDFILFAQHGWADDNRAMLALAKNLAPENTVIVAPCLNYAQTWLRIAPLIEAVEGTARQTLAQYPEVPLRIIGHSMGGLIWLELLDRYPEWWPRVSSLVLVASPIGGADLGRLFDPLSLGLGIAADLGKNRRPLAEKIAVQIPTLAIAGDIDGGSDGTIPIESTKVAQAQFVCLPGLDHASLRNHPKVVSTILAFWQGAALSPPLTFHSVIQALRAVPGMTDSHPRHFAQAKIWATFPDGSSLRIWRSPFGVTDVFVASADQQCLYSGFVGWLHSADLEKALHHLQKTALG